MMYQTAHSICDDFATSDFVPDSYVPKPSPRPQSASFFWAGRAPSQLPRKKDGTLLLPDVCLDFKEGRADQYTFTLSGRGSTIMGEAKPKPFSDAASNRAEKRARIRGAAETRRRAERRLVRIEWKYDPDARIPVETEFIQGGIPRTNYQIRWRDQGSLHQLPGRAKFQRAFTGDANEVCLNIKVEQDEDRHIEPSSIDVSLGEVEWILSNYAPNSLRHELALAECWSDMEKAQKAVARFLHRHRRVVEDHAIGMRYTPVEVWQDDDPLGQGRTDRPIKGRSPKVTEALRMALSAIDVDEWHKCLLVTIAPPDDVDDIQFLRDAEKAIRCIELAHDPFYWLRSTETRTWQPKHPFDRPPRVLGLHDHYLLQAWADLRPEERKEWADGVWGHVYEELKNRYPSMAVEAVHVRLVNNRTHMTRLVRGEGGGPPYLCKDMEDPGRIVSRRWWNDRNPEPDLSFFDQKTAQMNVLQVAGDSWRVDVDQKTFLKIRNIIHEYLERPLPQYAVQYAFHALEKCTILGILRDAGIDVSAAPTRWLFRRPQILDDIPASLGVWTPP